MQGSWVKVIVTNDYRFIFREEKFLFYFLEKRQIRWPDLLERKDNNVATPDFFTRVFEAQNKSHAGKFRIYCDTNPCRLSSEKKKI